MLKIIIRFPACKRKTFPLSKSFRPDLEPHQSLARACWGLCARRLSSRCIKMTDHPLPHSATVNNTCNHASTALLFYGGEVTDTALGQLYISQFLGAFAKLRKATIRFVMSVCPFVWSRETRLQLDVFSWNLISDNIWLNSSYKEIYYRHNLCR